MNTRGGERGARGRSGARRGLGRAVACALALGCIASRAPRAAHAQSRPDRDVPAAQFVTAGASSEPPPRAAAPPTVVNGVPPLAPSAPPLAPERVTLAQVVARALARNPAIAVAQAEVRRAHALMEQTRAISLPQLNATVTATRLDHDRMANGIVFAPASQLNATAVLEVPIVAPVRWVLWQQAGAREGVVRAAAAAVRQQLAGEVAGAYLVVIARKRVIEVLEHALENARAHYAFAHLRFEGAIGARLDEVRAAQQVAVVQAQLEAARAQLTRGREALGVLAGANGPLDTADEPLLAPPPPLAGALATVPTGRADVRQLAAAQRLAERVERETWVEYLPYLAGIFQPFNQNPPTPTLPQFGWQAQLVLSIPLFDGGLRIGHQHERAALTAEARVMLQDVLRRARAEVRAAFEAVRHADSALAQARAAARLANEAFVLANQAFRVGTVTGLDVLDAERIARDAETAVATAENDARQARLDLLVAAGRFP